MMIAQRIKQNKSFLVCERICFVSYLDVVYKQELRKFFKFIALVDAVGKNSNSDNDLLVIVLLGLVTGLS